MLIYSLQLSIQNTLSLSSVSCSSFQKQHNDDGAIFQRFKDLNELLQEMLELKNRYVIVESELKEMQDRYSQLSMQFADVEGERQKLEMTLKNRVPKNS